MAAATRTGISNPHRAAAVLLLAALLAGCAGEGTGASPGEIDARPTRAGGWSCRPGAHRLETGSPRRVLMRVTAGAVGGRKALLLVLHGAGGGARDGLWALRGGSDARGLVMVAPAARGPTWSALYGRDTDLQTVDRALAEAFRRCPIDPGRVGVGGFSDGATYALSLGLANGRLFRAVIALSPGGIVGGEREGKPRISSRTGDATGCCPSQRHAASSFRDFVRPGTG